MTVVSVIVLAAGSSSRMGRQKLALPLEDGTPMVLRVLQTAADSLKSIPTLAKLPQERPSQVVAVIAQSDEVVAGLTAKGDWRQVWNPDPRMGMSSSLRIGINDAWLHGADAALIVLGDQPGVTKAHITGVIQAYLSHPAPIVQAAYSGHPGHPILFDQSLFPELLEVQGDEGGRSVVQKHRQERKLVAFLGDVPVDLDTPEAYKTWLDQFDHRRH